MTALNSLLMVDTCSSNEATLCHRYDYHLFCLVMMGHNCTDWKTTPLGRKTPLLILSHGEYHVYATVPKTFSVGLMILAPVISHGCRHSGLRGTGQE